uniref:Putative phosphomethyl pyrimidine kinase n=1 Tax=Listeria monocytogenes TaxID=1639 RepID=Q9EXF0_LISMN|nr:putative phosphomethyl pyrimidine kinase [Listeria monocytogenes]
MIFPQVLTIAGSDSGGGAGIQADIKTFQERKTFGMSRHYAIAAQNTLGVKAVHKIPVEMIREQCDAIAEDFSSERRENWNASRCRNYPGSGAEYTFAQLPKYRY